jgi:transposase
MSTTTEMNYFDERGLTLAFEKVFMVHDDEGNRVETRVFFSLPFDSILEPYVDILKNLYKWRDGSRGNVPYPPEAMIKAIIYAKLNKNLSDRHLERHLLRQKDIASALGFEKVPSHHTISQFKRERLTINLLAEIFATLRDHLLASGKIDLQSITIDSAPVKAFASIAKANRTIKLYDSLACSMLNDKDYKELAKALVESLPYKKTSQKQVMKRIACLNLIVLYELGGFLSHSKVAKYLSRKEHSALLKLVSMGSKIPSDVMLSTFKKYLNESRNSVEFKAFHDYLSNFYQEMQCPVECTLDLLFPSLFAVLQKSATMVDPDARLGYCAAKKQAFLGYRVQLIIDDKKNSR